MVTLQKSEKRKDHSNRVKITLKMSENHSKASENHSEESENHSKRVTFTFWGELTDGQLETKEWFSLVLRVIFTRLEWSLRFSLFWRVTISLFLH